MRGSAAEIWARTVTFSVYDLPVALDKINPSYLQTIRTVYCSSRSLAKLLQILLTPIYPACLTGFKSTGYPLTLQKQSFIFRENLRIENVHIYTWMVARSHKSLVMFLGISVDEQLDLHAQINRVSKNVNFISVCTKNMIMY